MPCRNTVNHQTVFDVLHTALLHCIQKIFLLDVLNEDMLIFFIDNLLAVTDNVLKEIIAALFQA